MEVSRITEFKGVNYSVQPRGLALGESLIANNVDLSQGSIRTRRGAAIALPALGNRVYGLYERKWGGTHYSYQNVETSVYRSTTEIGTDWARNNAFYASYDLYTYITNGTERGKDDGTTASLWGIAVPTTAPSVATGAAGIPNGTYSFKKTRYDSGTGYESNASGASSDVTVSSQKIDVSGLVETAPTGTQYDFHRLYRKSGILEDWYYVVDVAKATDTYTSNEADSALGSALATDNDRPPLAKYVCEPLYQKLAMANTTVNPNYFFVSKENLPGSFPLTNVLHIGDAGMPIQGIVPWRGTWIVFTFITIWKVYGSVIEIMSVQDTPVTRGCVAPRSIAVSPYGIFYLGYDGVYLFTGENSIRISTQLDPLFAEEEGHSEPHFPTQSEGSLSVAWGIYKDGNYWLCMPQFPGAQPTKAFVFNVVRKQWFTRPLQAYLGYASPYTNKLYFASFTGDIWSHPEGYNDSGTAISYQYFTGPLPVGDLADRHFRHLRVDMDSQGQDVTINVYVNGVKAKTETRAVAGRRWEEVDIDRPGFYANVEFTGTALSEIRFYGLEMWYKPIPWV